MRRHAWLLAFSGIAQFAIAAIYLLMRTADGPLTFHSWRRTVILLGFLELTAGILALGAGIGRYAPKLIAVNGAALTALGVIHSFLMRFPIRFSLIAGLVILIALSNAWIALRMRQNRRVLVRRDGTAMVAAVGSIAFAAVFVALIFRWIPIAPGSTVDLAWLGCFFALSAACMLGFASRPA